MATLKIKDCSGYSKEEAFANLNFDPNNVLIKGSNATQAWIKHGRPSPGTKNFKIFAIQQLAEKTKNKPGYGLHIVLEGSVEDNRKRPYFVVNNKTTATREWTIAYLIREDELEAECIPDEDSYDENATKIDVNIIKMGQIVDTCESKAEALEKMKQLTTETHKDYTALAVKLPDINAASAFCLYTPGKKTKKGHFIAFGYDKEVDIK